MGKNIKNSEIRVQRLVERIEGGDANEVVQDWDDSVDGLTEEQKDKVRRVLAWTNAVDGSAIEKVFPAI